MAKPVHITSTSEFQKTISSSTCVVVDFYADWCGPCKAIAPVFESLCASESKPGKMAFCKVDVDSQQAIARQYGVSAMPTFLIFHRGSVRDTIRGANPAALRTAVMTASKAAGGASGASFSSKGYTLGGGGSSLSSLSRSSAFVSSGSNSMIPGGILGTVTRFVGLYFTTLLTLDPREAAEASPFRADGPRR